jgi:hypothetical protein
MHIVRGCPEEGNPYPYHQVPHCQMDCDWTHYPDACDQVWTSSCSAGHTTAGIPAGAVCKGSESCHQYKRIPVIDDATYCNIIGEQLVCDTLELLQSTAVQLSCTAGCPLIRKLSRTENVKIILMLLMLEGNI